MRAVSVHRDALVVTSRMWQTTATALRSGGEAVLIDSPYFPDELEALAPLLAQAGFEPDGLLATHGDFDHLLGRLAFPALALGVGEPTALRLRAEPGAAQRELRDEDDEHYVSRPAPLSLGRRAGASGAGPGGSRRGGARAAPRGGAHRRRVRGVRADRSACSWWATTCPTWSCR